MINAQEYMTADEASAYAYAASLAAANEKDRAAWNAACEAEKNARLRAVEAFCGPVQFNRNGRPKGGAHPAIAAMRFLSFSACFAPAN